MHLADISSVDDDAIKRDEGAIGNPGTPDWIDKSINPGKPDWIDKRIPIQSGVPSL
jgi:hypothetical protein